MQNATRPPYGDKDMTEQKSVVKYSKKWFNPLFFILKDIQATKPNVNKIFVYGSKSSAKTFTIGQFIEIECLKGLSAIAYRKESARINDTIKKSFTSALKYTRITNAYTVMDKQYRNIVGGEIVMRGLDSESKVKGLEGYSYLLFDELDHFTQEEFTEADLSFRGEVAKIAFFTWNPVSDKLWIKGHLDAINWTESEYKLPSENSFVKISECGTMVLIKTDYQDNYWTVGSPCGEYGYRDEALIEKYNQLKAYNYNKWRVVACGEWGIAEVKSPAFPTFDIKKHVGKTEMVSGIPLLFFIDFNNNPLACIVFQIYRNETGHKIRGLKEIKITPKEGIHNTQLLIDFIKANYPNHVHSLCMTTDATGTQKTAAGLSNILQLNKAFNLGRRLQTPTINPKVKDSVELVNYVFYHHPDILLDPSMETLIFELQNTERDADGGLIKDKRDDATQRADFVDALRYGANWHFFLNDNIYKFPSKFGIKA